jgi:hypothetical protein
VINTWGVTLTPAQCSIRTQPGSIPTYALIQFLKNIQRKNFSAHPRAMLPRPHEILPLHHFVFRRRPCETPPVGGQLQHAVRHPGPATRLPWHGGRQQASLAAWLPRVVGCPMEIKGNTKSYSFDYGSSFLHIHRAEASIARPPSSGHASLPPCAVLCFLAVLRSPWWWSCVRGGGCDIRYSLEFGP